MKTKTKAIHFSYQKPDAYGALTMPVYHTAAYEFADADIMADAFCGRVELPDYSRITNPTVIYLEKKVQALTGASSVWAFTSGMAAITGTLMCLAASGKTIITSNHLFGNTWLLISKTLGRFGVRSKFIDLTDLQAVRAAIDSDACCIYAEIISNPHQEVVDLKAISEIAHSAGIPLVADTTMIPFTKFSSRELGVDVEVVSTTKYLSGGATTVGGMVMAYGGQGSILESHTGFEAEMKDIQLNLGGYMSPHAAYMQTLGLENLDARYAVESSNTQRIAELLRTLPAVKKVNYLGLPDNPFHELAKKQFGGTFGAMLTIDLADQQSCFRFLNNLKLVKRATNLFDNRSLAIHPYSTIFGTFTAEQKRALDIFDTTIRLSIGLEDVEDIFEDFKQALD
ncbi:MAG: aminotransferase class V-fold PLP-dependent enzyme [Bacteroidales bacterium]|nr:aminotransferase class V-fold PLP-dependent enzyme [Bacteroidales bacterium]